MPKVLLPSLLTAFLSALLAADSSATLARDASAPNIVLIFIDDLGYGDIGPFGSTKNRTPHLDRMAREGMKLTSFYAAPVCSVSRAQVITGCYGQRVSIPGVFGPANRQGINADEHTVAELLKAQGYATTCIGKWHLGDQPAFLPTRHGFDHYFGVPYSNDMTRRAATGTSPVVPLLRDEKVIELVDAEHQSFLTQRYTDEAVRFMRENKDRPFFLYLPHTAVHTPIHPGAQFSGKSPHGIFHDWVEEVDWSVGQVLDEIRNLKLDQQTLVMFTSDNGPWLSQGKLGGEAGPLRSGKGSTWEGGVREPTVAWWPGKIAPGSVCDAVAGNIDFLPTFVSLAGGKIPTDRAIDGRDFSPLLFGKTKESQREAHYYYRGYKLNAVRSGPWKLALVSQGDEHRKGDPAGNPVVEGMRLYNLDTDIGEKSDISQQHPDVVARLKALAEKMAAELGDGKPGPAVRPAGEVTNPVMLYDAAPNPPAKKGKAAAATSPAKPFKAEMLDTLKVGDTLAGESAPPVAKQPFQIDCEVTPTSPSGVIVAHGGSGAGYTLYLDQGDIVFSVRTDTGTVTSIRASKIPSGKVTLIAQLAKDGAMTLAVNGQRAANGKAPSLLPRQPQENFCVGHDDAHPVDKYPQGAKFSGTVEKLRVTNDVNP